MAISRRQFVTGAALGVGGIAVGAAGASAVAASQPAEPLPGSQTEPFYGPHQSGIATPAQAYAVFAAYDLRPGVTRVEIGRMMRLLSDDAVRLTQGRGALGDTEPELGTAPSRLTVTFGFGPAFFDRLGLADQKPPGLEQLPSFEIDALEERWSGGDFLIQVCADDALTLSHAQRMLWKDSRAFVTPRWRQDGFLSARGSDEPGQTPRNLLGQVDGTVNPRQAEEFDAMVWSDGPPAWFAGGTMLAVRRISMDLDRWDRVDRPDREQTVGRTLDNGAPLTGTDEFDEPDLEALGPNGFPVISDFAHIRRARAATGATGPQFLRRGYNYDLGEDASGETDAGHIFTAYAADLATQFVPVQQALSDVDLLNQWTKPIGSAVFALPPGAPEGGSVGQALLG
jgi:dye decolorizing peroxidase